MKILLYLEAENFLRKSGIGRAIIHQQRALDIAGVAYTTDPHEDFDIAHINTYGIKSLMLIFRAKRMGKKVICHGHSTMEDFKNSFVCSNLLAPLVKKYLTFLYNQADMVITPTEYSKKLISSYGIKAPIVAISNGIDLTKYARSTKKEQAFKQYFKIKDGQKIIMCAALYFKRKGIDDFCKIAEMMPDVRFIWFGETNVWTIPRWVRHLVKTNHPKNVEFPGYIKGDIYEGAMTASDVFFFPSHEETEGIVVLEALASDQNVVARDIPVYDGWLDNSAATFAKTNSDFVSALKNVLNGKIDKRQVGYQVAESRSIESISSQLVAAYQKLLGE
ncbi:glycosyl transferase [Lactococcus hodotermopsidis]|uniref:Glycosyl transferase n=1 Tax=Pseudolactococcus hodotermopsidis TaxID=2709157 RepID=A0A6A0BGZ4_9LACT|nr:glycosyltransferase [Lactococcus hodotermopsidis]GFH43057.1 glycosyl transferase [Lactococcus hodotermopsidis]